MSLVDFKRGRNSPARSTEQLGMPILSIKNGQRGQRACEPPCTCLSPAVLTLCVQSPSPSVLEVVRALLARASRAAQTHTRTVCKLRCAFLPLVKTILKSHFPLIKYNSVPPMHA